MTRSGRRIASIIQCMRSPTSERTEDRDLAQMERWISWVIRLTAHAASQATLPSTRERLEGAREDAESLRDALAAAASGWLDAGQVAIVHSVYDLWDANHDRTERLCALVDATWYRRWRMRSASARPERLDSRSPRALSEASV